MVEPTKPELEQTLQKLHDANTRIEELEEKLKEKRKAVKLLKTNNAALNKQLTLVYNNR